MILTENLSLTLKRNRAIDLKLCVPETRSYSLPTPEIKSKTEILKFRRAEREGDKLLVYILNVCDIQTIV